MVVVFQVMTPYSVTSGGETYWLYFHSQSVSRSLQDTGTHASDYMLSKLWKTKARIFTSIKSSDFTIWS